MVMEHEMCTCGHSKTQHHDDTSKCGWCDECKGFELDIEDFLQYIHNEIHRRAEQIKEYTTYCQAVITKSIKGR